MWCVILALGGGVQDYSQLHSEFEAGLGYVRYLRERRKAVTVSLLILFPVAWGEPVVDRSLYTVLRITIK